MQMFYKIGVLKNVCKFHRKAPVLEFLFIKVVDPKACNFNLKQSPTQVFCYETCKIFKSTFFYTTHPLASSKNNEQQQLFVGFANNW